MALAQEFGVNPHPKRGGSLIISSIFLVALSQQGIFVRR
jgi:hypothetical protein